MSRPRLGGYNVAAFRGGEEVVRLGILATDPEQAVGLAFDAWWALDPRPVQLGDVLVAFLPDGTEVSRQVVEL